MRALVETFPMISRLKMLRQWGGIVDVPATARQSCRKHRLDGVRQLRLGHRRVQGDPGSGWGMAELMAKGGIRR